MSDDAHPAVARSVAERTGLHAAGDGRSNGEGLMRGLWMWIGVGCLVLMCIAAFQDNYEMATYYAALAALARISAHDER